MNLRRFRWIITLLATLLTTLATVSLSIAGYRLGAHDLRRDTARQAERQMSEALIALKNGGKPDKDNPTWWVRNDGASEAFSESPADPPLRSLQQQVDSPDARESSDTFARGDDHYFALVRPLNEAEALVTVVNLADESDRRWSVLKRLVAGAVLLIGLAFGVAWWVAGRVLAPARRALVERRGFLADAAHEMRTPLAIIQASASQALSRPREAEEYVRSLAEIRSASERAAAGVNELLDLARLESGQAIPRLAPLRLDLLAEEVAASIRVDGSEVVADEASAAVVVDADMALLRQAIDNVVRNAARRAPNVRMSTAIEGRDGVLSIADDGPGFDPNLLPHVFDRFRRGDSRGEVGLGLALVQAILAAHGGAAAAANREGGGAVVTLRVPLTRAGLN